MNVEATARHVFRPSGREVSRELYLWRQSSWEPAFGPDKFLTLTRALKMNLAVGRVHETYRTRWAGRVSK